MPRTHRLTISLTEAPHFRRLVDFVADVERYADEESDTVLKALVDDLRDDLASPWDEED